MILLVAALAPKVSAGLLRSLGPRRRSMLVQTPAETNHAARRVGPIQPAFVRRDWTRSREPGKVGDRRRHP